MPLARMAFSTPWNQIVDRWRSSNIAIRPGVSPDDIDAFQNKYGVVLPVDVRKYFMTSDGIGDDMDDDNFRFWPLSEVKPVHEELADTEHGIYPDRFAYPNCFVFADYCIWCWAYAVKLTDDPTQPAPVFGVTASETPGQQIAPSFREFMVNYAADPYTVM